MFIIQLSKLFEIDRFVDEGDNEAIKSGIANKSNRKFSTVRAIRKDKSMGENVQIVQEGHCWNYQNVNGKSLNEKSLIMQIFGNDMTLQMLDIWK